MSKLKRLNDLNQEDLKKSLTFLPEEGIFIRNKTGGKVGTLSYNKKRCLKYYVQICVFGKLYYAQRLAYLYMTGDWPNGDIDHIDGNGLNNKWSNLRVVSAKENSKNQKLAKNNTSGIMGVSWRKRGDCWGVYITSEGVRYHLGVFRDFFEACCVRKSAENRFKFHTNHGSVNNI